MNKKMKSPAKVLLICLLIVAIIGISAYYLFVFNDGKHNPFLIEASDSDTFDDDLYLYQTADENIVIDDENGVGYVNNELLVTAQDGVGKDIVAESIRSKGGHIVGFNTYLNSYQVQFDQTYSKEELAALRQEFSDIDIFEKTRVNMAFEWVEDSIFRPNDSKWKGKWESSPGGINWGAEAILAPEMWGDYDRTSDPVNVGVLDNQFYTGHEDLSFASTFLNDFSIGKDGKAHGYYGHGTHVSGTIGAIFNNEKGIAGIAPRVKLYGVSMLGLANRSVTTNNSRMTVNEIEAGLTYLIIIKECKVVNFSYGWGDEKVAEEIVDTLLYFIEHDNADFLIVCSAGNGGADEIPDDAKDNSSLTYITNSTIKDRIIVVGAAKLLQDGTIKVAEYSNYGSRVDIIAPGSKIYSSVYQPINPLTATFSHHGYAYLSGTSMAAPHVSGVAATIWSINPKLNGSEVKKILCDTASGSYGYEDHAKYTDTYKLLNAYKAAKAVSNDDSTKNSGIDIFANLSETFVFASGVGAWSTEVQIKPDGTFIGYYHDSDTGGAGADYPNGTRKECRFSGKFTVVKEISDYEYSMSIEYLNTEGILGEEKIIDGVKVITAKPYGFDDADEFLLYLPGRSTADLPEEYLEWMIISNAWGPEMPELLPFYGLYNVLGEQGYSSFKPTPSPTTTPESYPEATSTAATTMETVTTTTATANTPSLYSSYAFLVSVDTQKGLAQLDYVNRLEGKEMVDWLVENKGYTREEAGYYEPPYIFVNNNPQLRTVDLRSVYLSYIYGDTSTVCNYQEFVAEFQTYQKNGWRFICYISVDENGKPFAVDQVFVS